MNLQKPKFWNNDLNHIVFDFHNKFHFFISIFGGIFFGFVKTYSIGIGWEVYNGLCPWYDDPRYKHYNTDPGLKAWLLANFWLADKFSFQDAFIWDLGGALIGQVIRWIIIYYGLVV